MEEIEVKQITPREDATATCMTISELYPRLSKIK